MSTFSGLNIGLSSLYASRRGLELTGQNVANANTEGYSRQRVRLQGEGGPVVPALQAAYDGVGNGVTVVDTQRLRDAFLEARSVVERGADGALRARQAAYARLEGVLQEPSESGLQSQLDDFWSGWDDVANSPADSTARSQLLERAGTLAAGLNGAAERLEQQWSASREQLVATVAQVNAAADAVADFNKAIASAVQAGDSPNDLMDSRDLVVQQLAEKIGITTRSGPHGTTDVLLGGFALVEGRTSRQVEVGGGTSLAGAAPAPPATPAPVTVTAGGAPLAVGGTTGGLLAELKDVLPPFHAELAQVARQLHDSVNTQHAAGFDRSGAGGTAFFAIEATTGRIRVQITEPDAVAASAANGNGSGDRGGGNAVAVAELSTRAGGPSEVYRKMIVGLGVQAQSANRQVEIQANILAQVDAGREAEAGVNMDEEMSNMLAYQRAYEGAARFVSAIDQALDTLINRTGRVGL